MHDLKRDLIEFASIYLIVFWIIIADGSLAFGWKIALFFGCFSAMGGAFCGAKALWRKATNRSNGG